MTIFSLHIAGHRSLLVTSCDLRPATMICPICGSQLREPARFCRSCGANIAGALTGRLQTGRVLAERYRIVRLIARGGMGAVYLAADLRLDDVEVAVKEMSSVYRPGETEDYARAVAEFRREAALLARLSHPNLPRVIDRFEEDGKQFLAMEYVEGQTLRQALIARGGRAEVAEVCGWAAQLCAVLAYLHAQQPPIIYRDLKPGNVMLRSDGRVALIDFGIARFYKPGKASDTAIYGTIGYSAPEQYGEGQTDQRSDIYSLGVLLYHALTGYDVTSTPFRLPHLGQLRPDVPADLVDLITRATAMDPGDRFASVGELADALRRVGRGAASPSDGQHEPAPAQAMQPAANRPRGLPLWMFGTLLVLTVGLVAGLAFERSSGAAPPPTGAPAIATGAPAATARTVAAAPEIEPPPDMVRVPAGSFTMGADDDPSASPAHTVDLPTFFIDRTEVTNRAYRACVQVAVCQSPEQSAALPYAHYFDSPDFERYPVVYVTWQDARAYCAWRGRRLPTEAEWEKAARGTDARLYPWGNTWDEQRVRLSGDDLGSALAQAGSFAQNASPYGALDMSGNVWEWTSSRDLPYPYASSDGREIPTTPGQRVLRGGAWGRNPRNARVTTRDPKDPREGYWNRGFRCAATPINPAPNGAAAGNLAPAPDGMVGVPGGLLRMGVSEAEGQRWVREYGWNEPVAEFPQHTVTLAPFFLDRTEVTNQQYAAFVAATKRAPPANSFDPARLTLWRDGRAPPALAQHPVVNVTWDDARSYCAWAGKRLPTEAEWEWAARGPEGRLWPWGNDFDQQRANTQERGRGGTAPVGADPGNASWVGALDMGGNVWEWMSSLRWPYPYDPTDGREDPARPRPRAIRGGSWTDPASSAHTSGRNQFDPTLANINIGFRCAK